MLEQPNKGISFGGASVGKRNYPLAAALSIFRRHCCFFQLICSENPATCLNLRREIPVERNITY